MNNKQVIAALAAQGVETSKKASPDYFWRIYVSVDQ